MARWTMAGLVLSVCGSGCSGDSKDEDTDTDRCTTSVLASGPLDGETDVFYRAVVDASLARAEPDATITVRDASGADVPGELTRIGKRITFTADAPYTPGETYTSTLDWSCDPIESTFTIAADVGEPVDGSLLVGRTYMMDLLQGRPVVPVGIGDVFEASPPAKLFLAVDAAEAGGLQFTAGAGLDGVSDVQDLCAPTSAFSGLADYAENPYWTVTQDTIRLVVLTDVLDITSLKLSGAVAPGGAYLSGVSLDGILDTRDLTESLAPNSGDEDAVCNLFDASFGVECEACPDGSGAFCIQLVIDDLKLEEAPEDLVPRTEVEIAADPACVVTDR